MSNEEKLRLRIVDTKSNFLAASTGIESLVESAISKHFDPSRTKIFVNVVFHNDNEISFSKKIKMFERLLTLALPDFLKDNPDLINMLNRIRKLRNKFAHAMDLNPDELSPFIEKNYFQMAFYENGEVKKENFVFNDIAKRNEEIGISMSLIQQASYLLTLKHHPLEE
ncbi:MAG: hypothetical protein KC440_06515 [Nitrosarchaeum sp.]|nr:hypothetical protein [Nitrosarchaeum sp.]